MGCGGSKAAANVTEPEEIEISPDALREEITDIYKMYLEKRDQLEPHLLEKLSLQAMLDEKRQALTDIMVTMDKLKNEREPLLLQTWQRDAYDIYTAFNKQPIDKATLIFVIVNRTKWQLKAIADAFEKKYGKKLLEFVIQEMQTAAGKMFSGSNSNLGMLFTYRIMDQPERDAAFLRDASDGMSLKSREFIELVCTRSNAELHAAMEKYQSMFGRSLPEMIKQKASYENFKNFMLKVIECNRDEDNRPLDGDTAAKYAKELQEAGRNAEPFIRILAPINHIQFESINSKYKDNKLLQDICNKFSGDFRDALTTRVQSKYDYLASRLEIALGGMTGPDGEQICRIIGSLSRIECVKLHDSYNRLFPGHTLEARLKGAIKQESFLTACLNLLVSDVTLMPLGSDREVGEDEEECVRDGERAKISANINYKVKDVRERGEKIAAARRSEGISEEDVHVEDGGYESSKRAFKPSGFKSSLDETDKPRNSHDGDEHDEHDDDHHADKGVDELDEYGIPKYTWDPLRGRFMDVDRLTKELRIVKEVHELVATALETASDEVLALKDVYLQTVKHYVVTENWIRIYTNNIKNLKTFIANRKAKDEVSVKKSPKPK